MITLYVVRMVAFCASDPGSNLAQIENRNGVSLAVRIIFGGFLANLEEWDGLYTGRLRCRPISFMNVRKIYVDSSFLKDFIVLIKMFSQWFLAIFNARIYTQSENECKFT